MSKQEKDKENINSSKDYSNDVNIQQSIQNKNLFLGHKTNRYKIINFPSQENSHSKSTDYKTPKSSNKTEIYSKMENINKNEINIKDNFDLNDQIELELNKKYLNQNIILMTDYMKSLEEFDPFKRNVLLDWVMGICCSTHFKRETFHMTVSLIDICFIKLKGIPIDKFQLLGTACLLISSKYLEIYIPDLKKFSEFTGDTYSIQEIKDYEKKIIEFIKMENKFCRYFSVVKFNII